MMWEWKMGEVEKGLNQPKGDAFPTVYISE